MTPPGSYPTKIDRWLVLLVGGALCLSAGGGVMAMVVGRGLERYVPAGAAGLIWLGLALLIFPTRYTFRAEDLEIRSGVLRRRIPLKNIQRVEKTHTPVGAPAWSLDRLAITYRGGLAVISPVEQPRFLAELRDRAPQARVDD